MKAPKEHKPQQSRVFRESNPLRKTHSHNSIQRIMLPFTGNIIHNGYIRLFPDVYVDNNINIQATDINKLGQIRNILASYGQNVVPVCSYILTITNGTDSNPATIQMLPNQINLFQVNIKAWALRRNEIGFLMGLLVHELSAHILSDLEMQQNNQMQQEQQQNNNLFQINVGNRQYTLTPAQGNRQQDHINSAKITQGFALLPTMRPFHYMSSLSRMGNAMINMGNTGSLVELLSTCLFDISRIIVDDDNNRPLRIFIFSNRISDVMNWIYQQFLIVLPNFQPNPINYPGQNQNWITYLMMNNTTSGQIRIMLFSKLFGYIKSRIKYFILRDF